jgi:ATP-dependent Clp protease ATP-binding subunit ClpX
METGLDGPPFTHGQLVRYLDEHVTGHRVLKRKLARCLWWNQERRRLIVSGVDPKSIMDKKNLLLAGPTGQGKTLSIKTAAEAIGIPFYPTQATSYCAPGYRGMQVEDILNGLVAAAGNNLEKAKFGIVLIDEIDKIAIRPKLQFSDVGAVAVQQGLLAIVGGSFVLTQAGMLDTSGITFVVAGAFQGLSVAPDKRDHIPSSNLIRFGFIPEFVGRFSTRVELTPLTANEMADVLLHSRSSPFRKMQNTLRLYNVNLQADEEWVIQVVKRALQEDTGVRALNEVVDDQLGGLNDILTQLPAGSEILVTADGVVLPKLNPPQDDGNPFPMSGWTPSPANLPPLPPPPPPPPRPSIDELPPLRLTHKKPRRPLQLEDLRQSHEESKRDEEEQRPWGWPVPRREKRSMANKLEETWHLLVSAVKTHPVKIGALFLLVFMCGMFLAGAFNKNANTNNSAIEKKDGRPRLFPELDYPPTR